MSIHGESDVGDLLGKATKATEDLYSVRDTFFPLNPDAKISRLKQDSEFCLKLLDSAPPEQRKTPVQRATYEYLRGKVLDVFPDYRKEAEDHLSKAVKLNPSLSDAWLCLGNCIWKKGDLLSAKNCFTMALNKGPNKSILCQLSMLERKMAQGQPLGNAKDILVRSFIRHFVGHPGSPPWGQYICICGISVCKVYLDAHDNPKIYLQPFWIRVFLTALQYPYFKGTENEAEIVEESIQYAKEAIALDVKDGNSWYYLGNACLTSFFVTGAWDHSKLLQSLKAYQNAEKDERMKSNPDLFFNCATVNKYLENYERALSGFEAAASKDPGLNADQEVKKIVILLDKLDNLLKGQTKAKRLAPLVSSLATASLNPSYKKATVDQLSDGLNKTVAVAGKVLFFVKHENTTPLYYVVCDPNQRCFVLSVCGIHDSAIKEGNQVTLLEPWHRNISFSWKGKHYEYKSIRVDFIEQLLVNGKPLPPEHAIRASIHVQHKPS